MKLHSMFFNFNYNYLSPTGQSKFMWGISEFDINITLIDQLIAKTKLLPHEVFNVNLTAFNPIILDTNQKESEE